MFFHLGQNSFLTVIPTPSALQMVPISQAFSDHALKAPPTNFLFLQSCFNLQHALKTTAFSDARFPDSTLLLTSTHTP